MLDPRIIPCLLIKDGGLVKSINFKNHKYIGDPINAVKIFNEKQVDELMIFDIDATVLKKEPDYRMIEHLAEECRMPLCYGGGIKTTIQAERIFGLGVEKVAVSSAMIETPEIIYEIAQRVGRQSVVGVLDVRRSQDGTYKVFTQNGKHNTGKCPFKIARDLADHGLGELVVNSIDNDGAMKGYDIPLVEKMSECINIPLTVIGGAGSLRDIGRLIHRYGIIGAAAGSLFVFKGVYRAVLINYPNGEEKQLLIRENRRTH